MQANRILILTFGSRGDVEPFIALALGLIDRGFDVSLCTASRYREWVERYGVDFRPMTGELLEIMDTDEGRAVLEGSAGAIGAIRTGMKLAAFAKPINVRMMHDARAAADVVQPNLIVYHPKVLAAPHIAEKLRVPAVMAALQPMMVPTRDFPAAGMPLLPVPGYNRLSYKAISAGYGTYRKPVNAFRAAELGLGPIRNAAEVIEPDALGEIPVLHAISSHVVPRPGDWPARAHMTGYWRLAPDDAYEPPKALRDFLGDRARPVYVGFGSMPTKDPKGLGELVREALTLAGVRGIVSSGWGGLALEGRSEDVMSIGDVPHGWLFPKMAAVVHHGGAGTAASAYVAGTPSVVCPFTGDQPFWARRSVELGVGAAPVPRKKLTAERLARSIREAVDDDAIRTNAAELGRRLREEGGVGNAVELILRS